MDYRYLTETKNEFNNFLSGILVPHLYHGIKGMLKYSENVYNQIELKNKAGAKINNPGIINIFKKTLDGLSGLNNHEIEEEYLRIKNASGCVDWFDNLVRASFKSYVLFLTWDPKISNSKYSDNSIYETIVIKDFIHKSYIISCNYFRNNPEIFIGKNSKKEIFEILKTCVEMSIKKSLPYNQIIQEYLQIEFDKINDVNSQEIQNIKTMVHDIINDKKYGSRPNINNLIIDSANDEFVNLEDTEFKRAQLENFINQEKINEQHKLNEQINSEKSYKSYKSSKSYTNKKGVDTTTSDEESTNDQKQLGGNIESIGNIETNYSTSIVGSRAEMKNMEINKIINNSSISNNNNIGNELENQSLSQSNITSEQNDNLESDESENNDANTNTNINKTSEITKSKTSIENIITSPPIIRTKSKDKLNDLLEINKITGGTNNQTQPKLKKNIKVSKHKNNMLSEKFDQVESYYDNMIKI